MTDFVNPYTFVPLAHQVHRGRPVSHAAMEDDHLSGVLTVTLTAQTLLLIDGFDRKDSDGRTHPDVPRRAGGTPMIPGSGLLGAVRSIHEALAGGCLRVLNAGWVPVHRHPASTAETRDLRLAIVLDVDSGGRATSVSVCGEDEVIWVDQSILPRDRRVPHTGDRLALPAHKAVASGNRKVLRLPVNPDGRPTPRPAGVAPGEVHHEREMSADLDDTWTLLVTDTHARAAGKPVYFAAGRVGPGTRRLSVPASTWETYCHVVDGADDLRPARLPNGKQPVWDPERPEFEDVFWPLTPDGRPTGPAVAKRLLARRYLHPGQPIWVRTDGQQVTEIRLSQLWRYPGQYPVGERVGEAAPCTDPGHLCWSCRVFGSADTSGRRDDDIARQRSYRGHVRVDDLLVRGAFDPAEWELAPLAAPRPSAGQFYLDNTALPAAKKLAAKDTRPAATWGSLADEGRARPIRGRKFYWRTTNPGRGPHQRGKRRHQADTQTRDAVLIPAGTVFTGRVCFENLSTEDYGSLLAALDPRSLGAAGQAEWQGAVISLGGGKPFGFGAVCLDVAVEAVHTAAGRYLGQEEEVPGTAEALRAFADNVPQNVKATWPALRNALQLGFVPDDLVWYPPGSKGNKGDAEFDRSFEFFAHTNGLALSEKERDLISLPSASAPKEDQALDSAAGERPIAGGRPPQRRGRENARGRRPAGGRSA
jgi:hypothetical protein